MPGKEFAFFVATRRLDGQSVRRIPLPVNYAPRREKELLNDPGLVIVPPGPGRVAFWTSLVLAALMAAFFYWQVGKKEAGSEFGDRPHDGVGLRADRDYAIHTLIRSRHAHAPDANAGLTENSLRWFPHLTDGDLQPLWPWVMRSQVEEGHVRAGFEPERDAGLLRRVQSVQVWLLTGFVLLCGLMGARVLSPGALLPALLPGTLAVLLAYGTDFGPAGMNYVLVFLSWVCALRLLHRNSVWLHGVFGVLTGLAWLTDVTALLVVAAWLVAATARWVRICFRRGEQGLHETWIARNHFVGLLVVVIAWVAVCGSRCGASMDHWGRPLFAWQHHWMWLDNEAEARALTDYFEDTRSLTGRRIDLSGWDDYWKTHTVDQARERITAGGAQVWGQFLGLRPPQEPPAPFWKRGAQRQGVWLAGAAALCAAAWLVAVTRRRRDGPPAPLPCGSAACVMFVLLTGAGYGAWYAWYAPVQNDPRFLLVLYLPLMWSFLCGAEKMMTVARTRGLSRRGWLLWQGLLWTGTALLAADVLLLLGDTDSSLLLG